MTGKQVAHKIWRCHVYVLHLDNTIRGGEVCPVNGTVFQAAPKSDPSKKALTRGTFILVAKKLLAQKEEITSQKSQQHFSSAKINTYLKIRSSIPSDLSRRTKSSTGATNLTMTE